MASIHRGLMCPSHMQTEAGLLFRCYDGNGNIIVFYNSIQ